MNDYTFQIHPEIERDLLTWANDCLKHGIEFSVASAFRSYDRQLLIWNEKVEGKRALKNKDGNVIDPKVLTDHELLETILLWSHIPGVSRHHWGTDLDIFDGKWFRENNERLLLSNALYENGACHKLHQCNEQFLKDSAFAFYRPYNDGSSFMTELWHYSHRNIAAQFQQHYSYEIFVENLEQSTTLHLKNLLLKKSRSLYQKFVTFG